MKGVSTIQNNGRMTTICIPKIIADKLNLEKGERVYVEVNEKGEIIIKR